MRTKNFYLCLLLLVLSTANVWADKYYQPWDYRYEDPRFRNLSQMVGQKFMIYNTSFSDGTDLTGFLYDNGSGFMLDKTKERDRFVYNERFVYVLEHYGDANDGAYAIRSLTDGSYVGADGTTTHSTPQPIYIKDWDTAGTDGWVRSGVRCENEDFAGVNNGDITTASCQVFLLSNTATHTAETKYWNGDNSTFGVTVNGQPFAFYRVREVQSGSYLEDLHIFSRSDVYSAQVIWGYVQDAKQVTTSDGTSATTSLLIDGDFTTGTSTDYFRFNLGEAASSIYVYLQRSSADGDVVPDNVKIEASVNGTDGWVTIAEKNATNFASNISATMQINLNGSYQYIRISNAAAGKQIALSEAYILPYDEKTKQAFGYFAELAELDNPVYRCASAQQYEALMTHYNDTFPEAKTLSGVPLPGNKYRIYADAYDINTHTYVNKEICLDVTTNDAVLIKDAGSYNDQKVAGNPTTAYEWYCEKTNDGYLVFRNVANPDIYLANNGQASETAYKWSMSTVQTSRFGVPLWDGQGKYLTIANNGEGGNNGWVPDVTSAQDQAGTAGYTYQIAGAETPDDESDDRSETIASGICTDFVFIPVDITSNEKKITFTANEIAKRNSVFKVDEVVYSLPYSRMFTSKAELDNVTFTLQCPDIHRYEGTYVNNSTDAEDGGRVNPTSDVLTFEYDAINDGDVLDIRLSFTPFETCNDGSLPLYLVRSIRNQSIAQQAPGMRRADADIEIEDDGPIPTAGANVYYAKFAGRDKRMPLVPASKDAAVNSATVRTTFDATSLFYFQETEDNKKHDEYYSVSIRSAITPFMCENTASWTRTGDTWYVQPNVASGLVGYTIGLNVLNATNNPGDAWCTNHTDGDSIVSYYAEDPGAVWEFIEVDPEDAKFLLRDYIAEKKVDVEGIINSKKNKAGIDNDKADKYLTYLGGIYNNSLNASITVGALVDLAQKVHMLGHEVEFALQALPDVTNREDIGEALDYDFPHWYYIYNVRSKYAADGTTEQNEYYAKYVGPNTRMALEQVTDADGDGRKDFGLANMFYFEGREVAETIAEGTFNLVKDNELSIDDYLQVDIHNFVAPDTTLVSKNKLVIDPKENFHPGTGEKTIVSDINLEYNDTWRIECEYDFTGDKFESFNTFGSCLLSSTSPGITEYSKEFQVYLQDDRDIVVKLNNKYDDNIWDGTRDYYTNIKIVITHSPASTIFDIYNSKGDIKTFEFEDSPLNTVTKLTTMLPANGVKIKIIGIEEIEAYNWRKQDLSAGDPTIVDTKDDEDTWYILPSSNTKYKGFSIVAKGANDNNLGWTNVTASNKEIFSNAGNTNNSTWQFVRIEEFDDLVDELLEIYNPSDCVIYNKELAALSALIIKNSEYIKNNTSINDKTDEDYFNEIYEAIKIYTGPMPDDLKKPKPGSLYTIRPAVEEKSENALLVHVDAAKDDYSTRELYNDDAIHDDDVRGFDTRSVWQFEGTPDGNYLALNGLKAKNIHTLCYLEAPGAAESMVSDNAATITLKSLGACTTYIKAGDSYLATGNVLKYPKYDSENYTFWGEALNEYPAEVGAVFETINGHSTVHCKSVVVSVDTEGAVTVTFTHGGGAHKLNILGVTLVNEKDAVVAEEYHHGTAGDSHNNNIYNLGTITPGIYTLNCYVGQFDGGDNDKVYHAGGSLTIAGVSTASDVTNITNTGTENTKWIVEEITDPEEKIYYPIDIATHGHGTLMLGFDVKVPENISAFWPRQHGPIGSTHYMSMTSYDRGIIPANTPVMLKIDGITSDPTNFEPLAQKTSFKFYYSATPATEETPDKLDGVLYGALYNTFVRCADYRESDPNNHIFMLQKNQVVPQLYRIWENRNAQGVKANPSTQDLADGYIQCGANKAYWVMPYDYTPAQNVAFSLRYDGFFGGTTDIDEIEDAANNANAEADAVKTIFDLQGRKLDEITAPGIYIVNGVKVIVK